MASLRQDTVRLLDTYSLTAILEALENACVDKMQALEGEGLLMPAQEWQRMAGILLDANCQYNRVYDSTKAI